MANEPSRSGGFVRNVLGRVTGPIGTLALSTAARYQEIGAAWQSGNPRQMLGAAAAVVVDTAVAAAVIVGGAAVVAATLPVSAGVATGIAIGGLVAAGVASPDTTGAIMNGPGNLASNLVTDPRGTVAAIGTGISTAATQFREGFDRGMAGGEQPAPSSAAARTAPASPTTVASAYQPYAAATSTPASVAPAAASPAATPTVAPAGPAPVRVASATAPRPGM